jgi:hypothetical protein
VDTTTVTIKISKKHLDDLKDLLDEKDAISDRLIAMGKGHEGCDMNELAHALQDLVELAK